MIGLVTYCQACQRLSVSRNAALRALRQSGLSCSNGRFSTAWQTAAASIKLAGGMGERAA